jgi:chromate transporter
MAAGTDKGTKMILLKLFFVFFRVALFAIGGAYSFLPLMEKELVNNYHWLDKNEFLDVMGMSELFPGAISIKFATYAGYKVAGVPGIIVANCANLLPPLLLMLLVSLVYSKYKHIAVIKGALEMARYAMIALIFGIAVKMVNVGNLAQFKYVIVLLISFILFTSTKIHPAFIIVGAALYGGIMNWMTSP